VLGVSAKAHAAWAARLREPRLHLRRARPRDLRPSRSGRVVPNHAISSTAAAISTAAREIVVPVTVEVDGRVLFKAVGRAEAEYELDNEGVLMPGYTEKIWIDNPTLSPVSAARLGGVLIDHVPGVLTCATAGSARRARDDHSAVQSWMRESAR
jgi:hypothetical protein